MSSIEQSNHQAMHYCMEQIRESGKDGAELVLGAMALWVAAHGDFDLPETAGSDESDDATSPELPEVTPQEINLPATQARDLKAEILRTRDMADALRLLAQPIVDEAKEHVPLVDTSESEKKRFGRKAKKDKEKTGSVVNEYDRLVGNKMMWFDTKTFYEKHDRYNLLSGVEVCIGEGRRITPKVRVNISIENGTATSIFFSGHAARILLSETGVMDVPQVDGSPDHDYGYKEDVMNWDGDLLGGYPVYGFGRFHHPFKVHRIDFDDDRVKYTSWTNNTNGYGTVVSRNILTRRYDAENDVFRVEYVDNEQRTFIGSDVQPDDVMALAEGVLKLLPTRENPEFRKSGANRLSDIPSLLSVQ